MPNADPPPSAGLWLTGRDHVAAHVDPEVLGPRGTQPLRETLYGPASGNAALLDITQPREPVSHRRTEAATTEVHRDRQPQHLSPPSETVRRATQPRAYQPNQSRLDGER